MANLGNTIVNGILRVNSKVNVGESVTAPSFIGDLKGIADKAKQDSAGQQINTTYIKGLSVNGKTITYTKGDGTTGTITTQGDQYSAGEGLELSGTTFRLGKRWTAVTQGQKWSRICYIVPAHNVVGFNGILSIGATRGNVVCNYTFLINASHSSQVKITQLGGTTYSNVRIRGLANSGGNAYIELYDTANSIASGTTQQWYCHWTPTYPATLTTYTAFTDGTTVPSGFTVGSDFTTNGDSIIARTFRGNLVGGVTGTLTSANTSNTHLEGSQGKNVIVNSTAAATNYVTLFRRKSTNGVFTLNGYNARILLGYQTDASIAAGTNALNHSLIYDENGGLFPQVNNAHDLGTSSYKWRTVYATTFNGNATSATTATSATKLATARTINGVSFDGTANITVADNTKLPLAGGTVTGKAYFEQGTGVKVINGGAGTTGYFKVCTFTITSNYQNQYIKLNLTQRNRFGSLYIAFSSVNSTNPVINNFYKNGVGISARLVKSADGVFDLYVQKSEGYDNLEVTILEKGSYMAGTTITWVNTTVSALPSTTDFPTYKDATWLHINGNAASATQLATARTIGVSGVTGTAQSFDGSANIVIPITAVPASLLTGKTAIKGSEITNDKHWVPSSDNSVKNIMAMTQSSYESNKSGLASGTLVAIMDGVESTYVTTQATSLTCNLPLDL